MSEKDKVVRVDAETHKRVRVMAAERERSMAQIMRDAIKRAWEDRDDHRR